MNISLTVNMQVSFVKIRVGNEEVYLGWVFLHVIAWLAPDHDSFGLLSLR